MASEVSSTRLYLGNLPLDTSKADVEEYFTSRHPTGDIVEVKLMNGFGFIEYKDSMDARDVVPAFHGQDFNGNRLIVQFARGAKQRDQQFPTERPVPRTRRTIFRMTLTGLPGDTSWQDLKDFARLDGLDVVYSEVAREHDGKGFVEYETKDDLNAAVAKIDGREFKGMVVNCAAEIQSEAPRSRFRSRSPPRHGRPPGRGGPGGGPWGPRNDYYDENYYGRYPAPPAGYNMGGYRERSPPRRDYYEARDRYTRSPPAAPRGRPPPVEDYPPRRPYNDDGYPPARGGYGARPPPGYPEDPYAAGPRVPYGRGPPSPTRRPRSPPRDAYGGYERRGY